jgi:opacity protein-like surface antigen
MRSLFSALAALLLFAAPAAAQAPSKVFAHINFGVQSQSQDIAQSGEFSLYDENGSFEAKHTLEGGPFFEVGGGVSLMRNFSVGVSFAQRSKTDRDVALTALVPHPVFTDTLRSATGTAQGLEHKERAIHVAAMWRVPVTVEFDVTLFGGPSFFSIEDQLIESVTPTEVGGNFSQVDLTTVGVSSQKESAVGFNVGADARYMFMRNVGVGALLRYTRGSVTFTSPSGGADIKTDAGGLEIAGGLRFRF